MCRSIKPLFNLQPTVTDAEVYEAALQFVRKISGYRKPSKQNEAPFDQGVQEVAIATKRLLGSLTASTPPHGRVIHHHVRSQ